MQLANMLRFKMGWAVPSGPHHEIVLSSRIRLARNLRGHPFPNRASPKALAAVLREVFDAAQKTKPLAKAARVLLDEVDELDRLFLVERRLVSTLLAAEPKHRGVSVGERETLSLMANEEDHLRLQGVDSGLCLEDLFGRVGALDDELSSLLDFAFHREWGYLTACPTNTGTALRASCLVHLPGLSLTGQIDRILEGLSKLGMATRGLYGEGSKIMGDFYQISNATTLGPPEGAVVETVSKVVGGLVARESQARRDLTEGSQKLRMEDLVHRSLAMLRGARIISYEEAMRHLSCVRMALALGWKMGADFTAVNELLVLSQPGHIQMLAGKALDAGDRDFLRATLLRRRF